MGSCDFCIGFIEVIVVCSFWGVVGLSWIGEVVYGGFVGWMGGGEVIFRGEESWVGIRSYWGRKYNIEDDEV